METQRSSSCCSSDPENGTSPQKRCRRSSQLTAPSVSKDVLQPVSSPKKKKKSEESEPIPPECSLSPSVMDKDTVKLPSSKEKPNFHFNRPPACPVFHPSEEDFQDPLKFILRIRPKAQQYGICKIIPPPGWKPPFALDHDELKFTPRIQKINELEAGTRIKLNFFDKLSKFWALRGSTFRVPFVERRVLDLYHLHSLVEKEGGFEEVVRGKKWCVIAQQMGFVGKSVGPTLRYHYDQLLHPYFVDLNQKSNQDSSNSRPLCSIHNVETNKNGECEVCKIGSQAKVTPNFRELKSLAFLGPGPKMAVCDMNYHKSTPKTRTRGKKIMYEFDPLAKFLCKGCCNEHEDDTLISCEKCNDKYHPSCLTPNHSERSNKICIKCITVEAANPFEDFGFAQAEREYTLNQFEIMAEQFKKEYFGNTKIPTTFDVEQEFWRIVSSIDENVTVEYGADLHVIDHGSGFPLRNTQPVNGVCPDEWEKYAESPWNLNNLPVLNDSVLRYIKADISGMKIPWMYVGMCFSTFCWHNEDHWSYSINYLHWGEPKTWYGVPGSSAELFEETMKSAVPELFKGQPDLLHQLVTIMNPNELMEKGVPIVRTDQLPGEFVVTFPRAYHAGFNQGFNFAEACNFAPYDWLEMGRECISHYSAVNRFCVFSHDELVCSMAETDEQLTSRISVATYKDLKKMLNKETARRCELKSSAKTKAIVKVEKQRFDIIPDDERQCCVCKTTCFLSAVYCTCNSSKLTCLDHVSKLCNCSVQKLVFKYHFKLSEIYDMYKHLKHKYERPDIWLDRVRSALLNRHRRQRYKMSFDEYLDLVLEASDKNFPKHELIDTLEEQLVSTYKHALTAKYLQEGNKSNVTNDKILYSQFLKYYRAVKFLVCRIPGRSFVKKLRMDASKFVKNADKILRKDKVSITRVKKYANLGLSLNIKFYFKCDMVDQLLHKLNQSQWLLDYRTYKKHKHCFDLDFVTNMLVTSRLYSDNNLIQELAKEFRQEIYNADAWLRKLEDYVIMDKSPKVGKYIHLIEEAKSFHFRIPQAYNVKCLIEQFTAWDSMVRDILDNKRVVTVSVLSTSLDTAKSFPIYSDQLNDLEELYENASLWRKKATPLFLKEDDYIYLFQVIYPRKFKNRNLYHVDPICIDYFDTRHHELANVRLATSVRGYKMAEHYEIDSLFQLRLNNLEAKCYPEKANICGCTLPIEENFIDCSLCFTRYHVECFYGPDQPHYKHLCRYCFVSKRPSIADIEKLVEDGKRMNLKSTEFLIMECFLHRIKSWQKQIEPYLCKSQELSTEALHKLEILLTIGEAMEFTSTEKNMARKILSSQTQTKIMRAHTWKGLYDIPGLPMGFVSSLEDTTRLVLCPRATTLKLKRNIRAAIMEPPKEAEPSSIKRKRKSAQCVEKPSAGPSIGRVLSPSSILLADHLLASNNMRIKRKSKKRFTAKRGPRGVVPASVDLTELEAYNLTEQVEEHMENESCASEDCIKPCDTEVDWVQCDGQCSLWFHMKCVDLSKHDLTLEDEFICNKCYILSNPEEVEVQLDCSLPMKCETDPLL